MSRRKKTMKTRDEIQQLLEDVLGNDRVYFQAPPNTGMKYPCIVYKFVRFNVNHADNKPYIVTGHWDVHHMYKNPKYDMKEKFIFEIPFCKFDRRIVTDGVYNDYYIINQ
jgi:hypothetical protein